MRHLDKLIALLPGAVLLPYPLQTISPVSRAPEPFIALAMLAQQKYETAMNTS